MDKVVNRFAWVLRGRGVRISPAETIDAMRALGEIRISDREGVKVALSGTLVKNARDLRVFEEEFERFFRLRDWLAEEKDEGNGDGSRPESVEADVSLADPGEEAGNGTDPVSEVMDMFEKEKLRKSKQMHEDENDVAFSAMSQQLVLNAAQEALDNAMNDMATQVNVSRVTNPGKLGDLAPGGDPAATLDMELDLGAIEALREALDDLDLDEDITEKLRARIDEAMDRLPELLQKYLERLMAEKKKTQPNAEEISPMYRVAFTEDEQRQMEALLKRLGRKINTALSNRKNTGHRGRINIARTMRSNMKYHGLPFDPVFTNRKEDRPRLVVLADVSLSVRNTARFALHLVHNLQSLFSNVRTFAFVADLVEVTEYFENSDLDEVLGMIFGGEILDVDANSNYGLALEHFYQNHMTAINNRTTVLVLGDGRGNGNPANAWALEEIGRRARQLIWFTPEKEHYWILGGSDMPTYAELCDRVEYVRSLDEFDDVVDDMVSGALAAK